MANHMSPSPEHLIIEGNFKPRRITRFFSHFSKISLLLLALVVIAALGIYGLTVNYQSRINDISGRTRDMNEENRELEVELSRIRSFKNIEAAAAKTPQLRLPEEVLEIKPGKQVVLPELPFLKKEVPQVYGY